MSTSKLMQLTLDGKPLAFLQFDAQGDDLFVVVTARFEGAAAKLSPLFVLLQTMADHGPQPATRPATRAATKPKKTRR